MKIRELTGKALINAIDNMEQQLLFDDNGYTDTKDISLQCILDECDCLDLRFTPTGEIDSFRDIRYMVEINLKDDEYHQLAQSKWYNTEKEAMQWFKDLDFVDKNNVVVWLMSSEFDENDNCIEIEFEKEL
jgi:hypothetical protein